MASRSAATAASSADANEGAPSGKLESGVSSASAASEGRISDSSRTAPCAHAEADRDGMRYSVTKIFRHGGHLFSNTRVTDVLTRDAAIAPRAPHIIC